jgi:hypothetical protein
VAGDELADVHDKEEEGKNRTKCFFCVISGIVGDEILTYGYVKPPNQWFLTEETPDRSLQDHLGPHGLYPSGTLARTL